MKLRHVAECARALGVARRPLPLVKARLRLGRTVYPLDFTSRGGTQVLLEDDGDLTTLWHVCFGKEYDLPRDAKRIVDLGANIGVFALWALSQAPESEVFCVEAFPQTAERLTQSLKNNGLESRCRVLNCAVGGRRGALAFDARPNVTSNQRHAVHVASWKEIQETIEVPQITLADALDASGFEEVDFLKIDIEGSEFEMLEEASRETLRRSRRIALEWHGNGSFGDLRRALEEHGFAFEHGSAPDAISGLASFARV